MITRQRNTSMNKNMDVIALKKYSFLTHIIVSQGDWLWKPANIKGENNGSVVYFQSFLTVHNPMAQWWEHSPSTNVALVQFPALKSCVGWVCCWFSPFLRKVFLWLIRFSPLLNNQLFQIPIRFGRHGHFSTSSLELLSAPWVNKLHAFFFHGKLWINKLMRCFYWSVSSKR